MVEGGKRCVGSQRRPCPIRQGLADPAVPKTGKERAMTTTNHPSAQEVGWVLLFHQGLPVALCPVKAWEGSALELACEGMEVEARAQVQLQFTTASDRSSSLVRQAATVEGVRHGRMRLRLERSG